MPVVPTYPTHTNDQRTLGPSGVGVARETGVGWRSGAPSWDSARPLSTAAPGAMRVPFDVLDGEGGARSRPPWPSPSAASPSRRRLWPTGSSTRPSTAPATTSARRPRAPCSPTRTRASRWSSRPTASIVDRRLARRLHDARRYNVDRRPRHEFGIGGFVDARSSPARRPARRGNSGATAMTHGRGRQHLRRRLRRLAVDGRRALHRRRASSARARSASRRT